MFTCGTFPSSFMFICGTFPSSVISLCAFVCTYVPFLKMNIWSHARHFQVSSHIMGMCIYICVAFNHCHISDMGTYMVTCYVSEHDHMTAYISMSTQVP